MSNLNLYNTNRTRIIKNHGGLDNYSTIYRNNNFYLKKLQKNMFNEQNYSNLILSWSNNYNKINIINPNNYNKNNNNSSIYDYLKNNKNDFNPESSIETSNDLTLSNSKISNTKFVQDLVDNKISRIYNYIETDLIYNIKQNILNNYQIYNTETIQNIINNSYNAIKLKFYHVTESTYIITNTYNNLIIDCYCDIILPLNVSEGYIINIINKSTENILIQASDSSLIYNYFLSPNGSSELKIPPNISINLIFIIQTTTSVTSWHLHF